MLPTPEIPATRFLSLLAGSPVSSVQFSLFPLPFQASLLQTYLVCFHIAPIHGGNVLAGSIEVYPALFSWLKSNVSRSPRNTVAIRDGNKGNPKWKLAISNRSFHGGNFRRQILHQCRTYARSVLPVCICALYLVFTESFTTVFVLRTL